MTVMLKDGPLGLSGPWLGYLQHSVLALERSDLISWLDDYFSNC